MFFLKYSTNFIFIFNPYGKKSSFAFCAKPNRWLAYGRGAQDALLGLANALVALNEKRAACATLDKMRAEFATPRADLKDNIAGARTKAGCR